MSFRAVLRRRGFLALWSAQTISRVGDSIHEIALVWVVLEVTGDPALISATVIASVLPNMLLSIPAGTLVDRWNRKYVLVVTDVVRGLVVLSIPLVGRGESFVPVVIGAAFVAGFVEPFAGPARNATVPNVVPEAELDSANSLLQLSFSASRMLYVFGGVVVAAVGTFSAFYIDAATFFLSAAVLLFVPTAAGVPDRDEDKPRNDAGLRRVLADARIGLGYIKNSPLVISMLAAATLIGMASDPLGVILPVFTDRILGGGSAAFGLLWGGLFAGMFVGGLVVNRMNETLRAHRGRMVSLGLVAGGIALGATAVLPQRTPYPLVVASLALSVFGVSLTVVTVPINSLSQAVVPDDKRGRVFSVFTVVGLVGPPVGLALAGVFVELVGPVLALLTDAALVVLVGIGLSLTPLGRVTDDGTGERKDARTTTED